MAIRISANVGYPEGALKTKFEAWQKRMQAETREAVKIAAALTAEQTKLYISNRGTPKSGKAGRIETGAMRDDVSWRSKGNQHWGSAEAGWIDNQEDYYVYQEVGFRHIHAGWVTGMFAFDDAWREAEDLLRSSLHKIVN